MLFSASFKSSLILNILTNLVANPLGTEYQGDIDKGKQYTDCSRVTEGVVHLNSIVCIQRKPEYVVTDVVAGRIIRTQQHNDTGIAEHANHGENNHRSYGGPNQRENNIKELRKNRKLRQEDLAEKLQSMCDDEEIVNEIKNGADEFILSKYNWNDVANATFDLYKKVLKK